MSVEEKFYCEVAEILGLESPFETNPYKYYRTRWNNRKPGNGRFEGYGLVRYFGPNLVHVVLQKPKKINETFTSTSEALKFLKENI